MSFWSGVVQGVKDIDVLKEKEALADERQGVRDEETVRYNADIARQDRMDALKATQYATAEARLDASDAYTLEQDKLNRAEREAAAAESARRADLAFDWGQKVFWIGEDRTDESIALDMKKWDYGVARDDAQDAIAAIDRETDQEQYDFQVERLAQLDVINAAAVNENGRRYGIAQERLELLDIREAARIAKDDDRYAVAQSRIERLDAQELARFNTSQEQAAEALSVERGLAIIELGGSAFGSALTNGGGDVNAGNVISAGGMNSAVLGMTAELEAVGGMDKLDDTSKEWFKTVLANPDAAAGILAFAHAQREEGNDLSITELPKIIQLAGTMEAAGEEAYLDFKERFVAGNVDMKDPDQYLAGMQALMQYKPAQVVWGQVQAVDNPATKKLEFSTWETNTVTGASVALINMEDGPERDALLKTLTNAAKTGSEHVLTRGEAFVSLWDKYGRQAADELGLDKTNPHMRPYFSIMSNESPEGAFTSPTAPEAPVVPETSGMPLVGAPVESQATPTPAPLSFDTEEEARAYVDSLTPEAWAKIPSITIAGTAMVNGTSTVNADAPVGLGGEEPEVMPDTRSEGYRPTQMGATELNLPKFLEGLSEGTRKSVEAELAVMPKQEAPTVSLEDLSPDDLAELEAGVEEVISAIVGSADQGDIEVLVRGLNDKFTADIVGVAMRMAMGPNQ